MDWRSTDRFPRSEFVIRENHVKAWIILWLLFVFAGSCIADTYKCEQSNGKRTYQNWPCGTKPEIQKKPATKPDYTAIAKCGMQSGAANGFRAAEGEKPVPSGCGNVGSAQ